MTPAGSYSNPRQDLNIASNRDPNNEPQRDESFEPNPEDQSDCTESGYIGLAFSGGGYRAAAYSLGTMALLQDLKLLGKTMVLSGVSGGSLAVGAYLCGKAGSQAKSETEFKFYEKVYIPLMQEMDSEDFAAAFVSLPALLQGQKLILRAADATQALMSRLLGDEACFGNESLRNMLSNSALSPDYVFFNTTNISSLDLFRFGIQKGRNANRDAKEHGKEDGGGSWPSEPKHAGLAIASTAYILNRYLLRPDARGVCADLRDHAKLLRIGDCIASSYAFPGGFEPLIFPNDFFRSHSYNQDQDGEEASKAFSGSLICDQKPYIAFLDGGLYDNLGLASVEDIRTFLARKAQENPGTVQPIRYVIATDVDNINPANSAYREPSLERSLESAAQSEWAAQERSPSIRSLINNHAAAENPTPNRRGNEGFALSKIYQSLVLLLGPLLGHLLGLMLGLGLAFLLAWLLAQGNAITKMGLDKQLLQMAALTLEIGLVIFLGLIGLLLWLGWQQLGLRRPRRSGWSNAISSWWSALQEGAGLKPRRHSPPDPTWTTRLGLNKNFLSGSIDLDGFAVLRQFLWQLVSTANPAPQVAALKTALIERRFGQLGPAFSGYLKRTRSLTYGFLEQSYAQKRQQVASQIPENIFSTKGHLNPDHCYLIRNMIFELIPGPDMDPDQAANLITLPVKEFELQRQTEPLQPIMRKLRHAEIVVELINTISWHQGNNGYYLAPRPGQLPGLAWELICGDGDFIRIAKDLSIMQVVSIWTYLKDKLAFDPGHDNPKTVCATLSAMPIVELIDTVIKFLEVAKRGGRHIYTGNGIDSYADPGLETELRERCTVKLVDSADSYSWIPLICEMATNLNTTLWARGFRWYALNKLENQQIKEPGGWYSYLPTPFELRGRILLDFGDNSNAALKITALAGYLSMTFNLLEFLYATIGTSELATDRLANKLAAIMTETTQANQIGKNKPNQSTHLAQNPGSTTCLSSSLDSSTKQDDLFKQIINLPFKLRHKTFHRLHANKFSLKSHQLTMLEPWLNSREGSPETWR
jgi:hypothetical protein